MHQQNEQDKQQCHLAAWTINAITQLPTVILTAQATGVNCLARPESAVLAEF